MDQSLTLRAKALTCFALLLDVHAAAAAAAVPHQQVGLQEAERLVCTPRGEEGLEGGATVSSATELSRDHPWESGPAYYATNGVWESHPA